MEIQHAGNLRSAASGMNHTQLKIYQGDDDGAGASPQRIRSSVVPVSVRLRGSGGLYRYTTLVLWSCGILLVFILPVFAASLETPGFNTTSGPMAVERSPSGPASYGKQSLLKPVDSSLEQLLAQTDDMQRPAASSDEEPLPVNMESLRLLLPIASLTPESREYMTRTKPLAQILARRIQGSGLKLTLTVSSADRLPSAIQFVKELPMAAAISSDRVALSVSDDVPPDFLTIEVHCPLPSAESQE